MTKVISLHGGPAGEPEVNENVVSVLEDALERARSGDVIGIAVAMTHCDGKSSWMLGGMVASYSLLGAMAVAQADLLRMQFDE